MTPREKRRLKAQFDEQLRLERLGAPPDYIYPGISDRLTKSKPKELLWQVWVETKAKRLIPFGPAIGRAVADQLASTIRRFVAEGKERDIRDAQVFPCVVLGDN